MKFLSPVVTQVTMEKKLNNYFFYPLSKNPQNPFFFGKCNNRNPINLFVHKTAENLKKSQNLKTISKIIFCLSLIFLIFFIFSFHREKKGYPLSFAI